jgi:hypothetical protein
MLSRPAAAFVSLPPLQDSRSSIITKRGSEEASIGGWLVLSWIHIEDLRDNLSSNVWISPFHESRYLPAIIGLLIMNNGQAVSRFGTFQFDRTDESDLAGYSMKSRK